MHHLNHILSRCLPVSQLYIMLQMRKPRQVETTRLVFRPTGEGVIHKPPLPLSLPLAVL